MVIINKLINFFDFGLMGNYHLKNMLSAHAKKA